MLQSEVTDSQVTFNLTTNNTCIYNIWYYYFAFLPTLTDDVLLMQHPSLKSSDTENFSVNVDVDDEDDMSTDDDDDVSFFNFFNCSVTVDSNIYNLGRAMDAVFFHAFSHHIISWIISWSPEKKLFSHDNEIIFQHQNKCVVHLNARISYRNWNCQC